MPARYDSRATHLARQNRLLQQYSILADLVMHEGRFVSERTNNFLTINSLFFTGFFILNTQITSNDFWILTLNIALPVAGLVFCILHSMSIVRTINALNFWRSSVGLIELHPDYWYPHKIDDDVDLDIFTARSRYLSNHHVRQFEKPLLLDRLPKFLTSLAIRFPGSNRISAIWLPGLMGILWLLALGHGITRISDVVLATVSATQISTPVSTSTTVTPTLAITKTSTPTITHEPTMTPISRNIMVVRVAILDHPSNIVLSRIGGFFPSDP